MRVAVVADDLTGAADTGASFARTGFAVTLYLDRGGHAIGSGARARASFSSNERPPSAPQQPGGEPIESHPEVVVVDTATREGPPQAARETTERAIGELRQHGVDLCYLKVDSGLRGQVGLAVHAARVAWTAATFAIVAPAFPATGRTTVHRRQYAHGTLLPVEPLPAILSQAVLQHNGLEQAGTLAHADLTAVRESPLVESFHRHRDAGHAAVICDAETDSDLAAIARAGLDLGPDVVWVGSAGLAAQLASLLRSTPGLPARQDPRRERVARGPALVAVGSAAPIITDQVADLVRSGAAHVPLTPLGAPRFDTGRPGVPLSERDAERWHRPHHRSDGDPDQHPNDRYPNDRIEALLRQGRDVVVSLAGQTPNEADPRRAQALGRLVARHIGLAGAMIATGGETARALLQSCGTTTLEIIDEIEPGVVLSVADGRRRIPVITKAGAFGTPATLTRALHTLYRPRSGMYATDTHAMGDATARAERRSTPKGAPGGHHQG